MKRVRALACIQNGSPRARDFKNSKWCVKLLQCNFFNVSESCSECLRFLQDGYVGVLSCYSLKMFLNLYCRNVQTITSILNDVRAAGQRRVICLNGQKRSQTGGKRIQHTPAIACVIQPTCGSLVSCFVPTCAGTRNCLD